jgi:hypothetical protein
MLGVQRKELHTWENTLDLVLRLFLAISQSSFMCSAGTTSSCSPLSIRIGVVTGIFGSFFADSHFWWHKNAKGDRNGSAEGMRLGRVIKVFSRIRALI